jgi:hypothetical protein
MSSESGFAIVLRSLDDVVPHVLRALSDANDATIAFETVLNDCSARGVTGELLLLRQGDEERPVLRYPLRARAGHTVGRVREGVQSNRGRASA